MLVEFGGDPVEFGADRVRVAGAGVVQYGLEPAPVLGDGGVLAAQPADDRGEAGELGLQAGEGASFLVVVVLAEDAADGDAVFAQLPGRVGGGAGPAAQSGGVDAAAGLRRQEDQGAAELASFDLAPRHLSLPAYLLFDGPMTVNALARRLEVAPATVSLMVGDLSRQGILERREDPADRRRTIVSVAAGHLPAINGRLGRGAGAWRTALEPLTPAQRKMFIDTLLAYERAVTAARGG